MKILYLSPYLVNSDSNQKVTWTENLIKYLARDPDIDISLATVTTFRDKDYSFKENDVTYFYLKASRPRRLKLYLPDIVKLRKVIKQVKPDIIHVHGLEDCYGLASLYLDCPVLVSIQAAMGEVCKWYPWFSGMRIAFLYVNFALKRSKYIHVNSPYVENYYKSLLRKANIFRLDMPVSEVFLKVENQPNRDVITFVGNGLILKGADTLIKIAAVLRDNFPHLEARIIGGGTKDTFDHLKKLIFNYKIDQSVKFLGSLDFCEIAQQLSTTKILVVPTRCDIYGVSLAEALSAGVPVISSKIMGVPYVVDDGIDGFLLPPEDVRGFAEKTSLLLSNEKLRKQMGQKGREIAKKRWHPDLVAKGTLDVYKQILKAEQRRQFPEVT